VQTQMCDLFRAPAVSGASPAMARLFVLSLSLSLSAAQFRLPKVNHLGDVGKIAEAVASQPAVQALQKEKPMQDAKEVLDGMAKKQNISEALSAAPADKIAGVVQAAAGTLQKGVDVMDKADQKDVEAALGQVAGDTRSSNLTGAQLVGAIQAAAPTATQALQDALSNAEGENAGRGEDADVEAPVEHALDTVKKEVKSGGSPTSWLTLAMTMGACGLCAFSSRKRLQPSARNPSMEYGVQMQPSEEPFFRSF